MARQNFGYRVRARQKPAAVGDSDGYSEPEAGFRHARWSIEVRYSHAYSAVCPVAARTRSAGGCLMGKRFQCGPRRANFKICNNDHLAYRQSISA
jgi:hypothetical protein